MSEVFDDRLNFVAFEITCLFCSVDICKRKSYSNKKKLVFFFFRICLSIGLFSLPI